jgi:hypothetical protein
MLVTMTISSGRGFQAGKEGVATGMGGASIEVTSDE